MNKYIDTEKLKAEIERLEHENCMNGGEHFCMRRAICLGNLRNIITSSYHERPEVADAGKMDSLEYWLRQFGMPEENIKNCITQIAQGYGACRYLEGVQNGAEAVNELAQQGQQEVDLEEEIDRFLKSDESITFENAGSYKVAVKDPRKIARHFYELGKNSK